MIGAIQFLLQRQEHFYPWGFAMNGQTARLEATRQIIYRLKVEKIIETGTFRGTTTEWFSQFGLPVITIENHDRFFAFARSRLAPRNNVRLEKGSSSEVLPKLIEIGQPSTTVTFFYLDAHWQNYLPLQAELVLIFKHYSAAVVLIDDFKVSDDPGYGYDDYGNGDELTLRYVKACPLPPLRFFYPSTPSEQETGSKRGWVVLTSNNSLSERLGAISLLREFDPNAFEASD
jgi:predicted O-methyltransferase YrrM